ncbi:MAG TPA: DUF6184 family natural product biosynthesis lipoprotein [Gaiellaceae bacterium]|nr:DUF6184 family natural product biosynthesis lipoprotein [Gaiellaceae bacterium]
MPRSLLLAGASLAGAALAACGGGADRAPPTSGAFLTAAELGTSSNDEAVMRTATARCERELACNKIGQGRAFEDQPTCLAQMGERMDAEAGKSTCPRGVEPVAVSRCVLDIQQARCGGELDRAANVPSCTRAALCVR